MSILHVYRQDGTPESEPVFEHDLIRQTLDSLGVKFERWPVEQHIAHDAGEAQIKKIYADEIANLNQYFGFQSVDVVSLTPDHPQAAAARQKFLAEHTHADFEIRFFVDGDGLFYLHPNENVYLVLCEKGDLISVPANTPHWFDMGTRPDFKCIRFFTTDNGWEASFTGSEIAGRFPDYDTFTRIKQE